MTLNLLNTDLDIQLRLRELEQSDLANLDTVRQEATTNTSVLTALIDTKTGDNAAAIATLGAEHRRQHHGIIGDDNRQVRQPRRQDKSQHHRNIDAKHIDGPEHILHHELHHLQELNHNGGLKQPQR